jgi:HAD superfamily hydrolase (TIGR01509 family)
VSEAPGVAAVNFDLDGVLEDTEIWWDDVRREFAARHGRPWTDEDRASVMGANSRQWSATIAARLGLPLGPAAIETEIVASMVARWSSDPSPLIPGADTAVRRLAADYPLAVASSAHRAVIDAALTTTGLRPFFRVIVSSDEVAHGKPEPDVYLEAARRLDVEPPRCLPDRTGASDGR